MNSRIETDWLPSFKSDYDSLVVGDIIYEAEWPWDEEDPGDLDEHSWEDFVHAHVVIELVEEKDGEETTSLRCVPLRHYTKSEEEDTPRYRYQISRRCSKDKRQAYVNNLHFYLEMAQDYLSSADFMFRKMEGEEGSPAA